MALSSLLFLPAQAVKAAAEPSPIYFKKSLLSITFHLSSFRSARRDACQSKNFACKFTTFQPNYQTNRYFSPYKYSISTSQTAMMWHNEPNSTKKWKTLCMYFFLFKE